MSTPARQVRIPEDVWTRAQTRARVEGTTVSAVMRAAVLRYASEVDLDDYGRDWYAATYPSLVPPRST